MEGLIPLLYKVIRRNKSCRNYKSLSAGAAFYEDSGDRFDRYGFLTPARLSEEPEKIGGLPKKNRQRVGNYGAAVHVLCGAPKFVSAKGFRRSKSLTFVTGGRALGG